jgi:hypothetical protein
VRGDGRAIGLKDQRAMLEVHPDDLLLVAGGVALSVLLLAGIALGVWSNVRRGRVFLEVARGLGLTVTRLPGPWSGPVAGGAIEGRALEIGPVTLGASGSRMAFIRFRLHLGASDRLPPGLHVHTQIFRYNTAGPRHPGMPRYDGSADDPGTRGLVGDVPEITLGDPELDRAFVIQGDDEAQVRALLLQSHLRSLLLAAVADGGHLRLRAGSGVVELDVDATDLGRPADYDAHLGRLLQLAGAL